MSFAQQMTFGGRDSVVTGGDGRILDGLALQDTGVAPGVRPDARIALKLHDPLDIVRALAALDGQVEAVLLLSHALSSETAQMLARAADCSSAPSAARWWPAGPRSWWDCCSSSHPEDRSTLGLLASDAD